MINEIRKQFNGFLATPPLWTGNFEGIKQFDLPAQHFSSGLDLEEQIPSLASNSVMGKRMEKFFGFLIKTSKKYNLILSNRQVINEKVTLGEIDFIIEDTNRSLQLHIELVYKFYVYDPSFSHEYERWIGPNRKDSFLQKIRKLKEQQLPLLFKKETQTILSTLNLNSRRIEQEVCFKANLFVPKEYLNYNFHAINNSCIAGVWIHLNDFTEEVYGQYKYFAPEKQDWPILPKKNEIWFTFEKILPKVTYLTALKKSPLVWIKKPNFHFERIFIVWW